MFINLEKIDLITIKNSLENSLREGERKGAREAGHGDAMELIQVTLNKIEENL